MSSDKKTKVCPMEWSETSSEKYNADQDLPPSYALALFREKVSQTIQNQKQSKQAVVLEQPLSGSTPDLSKRPSLASTELILNPVTVKLDRPLLMRTRSQAWSDTVVIRNLHERDRMSITCFCVTTMTGIFTLAFYCTA